MKNRQRIIIICAFIVFGFSLIALVVLGGRYFLNNLYKGRDCKFCNIDNTEIRTKINIPYIKSVECLYNPAKEIQYNQFLINLEKVDISDYISKNNFLPVNDEAMDLSVFVEMQGQINMGQENITDFYVNKEDNKNESWVALLNKKTGGLWIYLKYKDKENIYSPLLSKSLGI